MTEEKTLRQAVQEIIERHGGWRQAEKATGVDQSQLSRMMSGVTTSPNPDTLRKLGLRRRVHITFSHR